jgi:hypothetical protein
MRTGIRRAVGAGAAWVMLLMPVLAVVVDGGAKRWL